MFVILNASPTPNPKPQLLVSLSSNALPDNGKHLSNALPENPRSAKKQILERSIFSDALPENPTIPYLPPEIYQHIFEYASMSFKEQKALGLSDYWAIRFYDPSTDNFKALQKWLRMKPSKHKDKFKKIIQENPKFKDFDLDKLLAWPRTRGFKPTFTNFRRANKEDNLEMAKFFVASGYKPTDMDLNIEIGQNHLRIVKFLIIEKGIMPGHDYSFIYAISDHQNPDMIRLLVENGEYQLLQTI